MDQSSSRHRQSQLSSHEQKRNQQDCKREEIKGELGPRIRFKILTIQRSSHHKNRWTGKLTTAGLLVSSLRREIHWYLQTI